MNINYTYLTTMYESISAQMYIFLVKLITIFAEKVGHFTSFLRHYYCMDTNSRFIHCSRITVVHVNILLGLKQGMQSAV